MSSACLSSVVSTTGQAAWDPNPPPAPPPLPPQVVQEVLSFLSCSPLEVVREALLPYCRRVCQPLPTSVAEGVRLAADMVNAKGGERRGTARV